MYMLLFCNGTKINVICAVVLHRWIFFKKNLLWALNCLLKQPLLHLRDDVRVKYLVHILPYIS